MTTKSLHVGNLSLSTTHATLSAAFSPYHPLAVRAFDHPGFGFVDVPENELSRAVSYMDGSLLDGRRIAVSEAAPKQGGELGRWGDDGGAQEGGR